LVTTPAIRFFRTLVVPRILGISPIAKPPSGTGFPNLGLSLGGTVPLSEHEQRQLDQIERALYAEDPKFANAVRSTDPHVHYKRRLFQAGLGVFLGICLVMAGVIMLTQTPIGIVIGAVGFVMAVVSCSWGLKTWKRVSSGEEGSGGPQSKSARPRQPRTGFMDRMEERWRRRRGEGP
jgi:Protein of unknown function (DUF3040)